MNMAMDALARWNALPAAEATASLLPCCGSVVWAQRLAAQRPFDTPESLFSASDTVWLALAEPDWQEAFNSHPRIGQSGAQRATAQSLAWSSGEQGAAMASQDDVARSALAEANRDYEAKFGRIFLVCASGKSTQEILAILRRRMSNSPQRELLEAVEQQRQITQLRMVRWLESAG